MGAEIWRKDSADAFFSKALGAHPLLSPEETRALIERAQKDLSEETAFIKDKIKQKDKEIFRTSLVALDGRIRPASQAMDKLLLCNQRFLFSQAKRFYTRLPSDIKKSVDFFDLVQLGNVALRRAVLGFDLSRKSAFSTYASWWTRQVMMRTTYDLNFSTVRLPVHVHGVRTAWKHFIARMYTSRLDWDESLAYFNGASLKELNDIAGQHEKSISLDAPPPGSDSDSAILGDAVLDKRVVPTDELVAKAEVQEAVRNLISAANLTDRELWVIFSRFGFYGNPETLAEIGDKIKLSSERIRQIETKALNKLRKADVKLKMNLEHNIDGAEMKGRCQIIKPRFSGGGLHELVRPLRYIPTVEKLFKILRMSPKSAKPLLKKYKKEFKAAEKVRKMKKIRKKRAKRVRARTRLLNCKNAKNPK